MDGNKICLIVVILLVSSLLCHHQSLALDLSTYQTASFVNPLSSSVFTHFVTHNETGAVYIGASDALYQLGEDFMRQLSVDTQVSECEGDTILTCPNYNKILLIDYTNDRLITCGSENMHISQNIRGTCNTRNLTNIDIVWESAQPVVSSGMLSTEAIIAPGPEGLALYVVNTYDTSSPEISRENLVFPLSRRSLKNNELFRLDEIDAYTKLDDNIYMLKSFLINYLSVFTLESFVYFVTHQRQEDTPDFISKISRVCQDEEDLNSFTEITLQCQVEDGDVVYNLIQAAHVGLAGPDLASSLGIIDGTDVFYGVFAKSEDDSVPSMRSVPSMQSALCIFKLDDIETALFDAVAGCLGRNNLDESDANRHQVNYLNGGRETASCQGLGVS